MPCDNADAREACGLPKDVRPELRGVHEIMQALLESKWSPKTAWSNDPHLHREIPCKYWKIWSGRGDSGLLHPKQELDGT
jgi:hypothetical protein